MKIFLILVIMLFCHTFYDFHLQGILAQMKQKEWWKRPSVDGERIELERTKYRNDYKMALAVHSFEWAFCIQLPLLVNVYNRCGDFGWFDVRSSLIFISMLVMNACFHYLIDDMKANDKTMSLVGDQMVHAIQVIIAWTIWLATIGF